MLHEVAHQHKLIHHQEKYLATCCFGVLVPAALPNLQGKRVADRKAVLPSQGRASFLDGESLLCHSHL